MTSLHSQPIQVLFATLFLIIFAAQDLICNVGATSRGLGAGGLAPPQPPPPAIKITKLAMRRTLLASKQIHPPSVKLPSALVPKPKLSHFRTNRYKFTETEAFRPTAPGKSPGAGHESPPTAL